MDNLSVHKAKVVCEVFDAAFQQVFLPPQSCNLNPIEKVWNIVKRLWRAQAHLVDGEGMRERNEAAVHRLNGIVDGSGPREAEAGGQEQLREHGPLAAGASDMRLYIN